MNDQTRDQQQDQGTNAPGFTGDTMESSDLLEE